MRGLRGLSESLSNFFLLVSEWRLDETITREADALAIINKDVSNLQTGWNTVVCSSVIHIFLFVPYRRCLAAAELHRARLSIVA